MNDQQKQIIRQIERKLPYLPEYVTRYIEYKQADDRAKPNTLLSYLYDYDRFFSWLTEEGYYDGEPRDVPLSVLEGLKRSDIDRFLLFLQRYSNISKRTSRNRLMSSLKSLFHFLSQIEEDDDGYPLLKRNVMAKVEIKSVKPSPQAQADRLKSRVFQTYQEVQKFLDYVAIHYPEDIQKSALKKPVKKRLLHYYNLNVERDLAILSLILGSGLRVSELVSLDLSDIDWTQRAVNVIRKGKEDDTLVHFSEEAENHLRSYLEIREQRYKPPNKENALFLSLPTGPNKKVARLSKRAVQTMVEKYSTWFGKRISVHNLRHTFATLHYRANKDIFGLQSQLGHANPSTTQKYTLIFDDTLQEMIRNMEKSKQNE